MAWWDFFKVFSYAFAEDPLSQRRLQDLRGAGVSQPDAMPDIRAGADGSWGGGRGTIRLRDSNDFVDLSTVTNRIHRYREYDRLRLVAEIEMAMTVFADEACFSGDTIVSTPTYGPRTMKWLADNMANERFLVYCYDQDKKDYTLGWAFNPRQTKVAKTICVMLDDSHKFRCTPDHRIMMKDGSWRAAGELKFGDELMPFYRVEARQDLTNCKTNQFPRIHTNNRGWINERQFVNEWTSGKPDPTLQDVNKYCRMVAGGLGVRKIHKLTGNEFSTIRERLARAGFSNKEVKWLAKKPDRRRVVGICESEEMPVYDLSVEKHQNFATDWGIAHNCQKDEDGHVLNITCKRKEIVEELEYLLFHRKMLNFDQKKVWDMAKQLFIFGDYFYELVIDPDNPKGGIVNLTPLPADSMYRIETTKGKLIEFQQSKEGPDWNSLSRVEITQATDADLQQATAIRFAPEQVVHIKIGDDRKTFYPYGVSLIEPARGPAHQLRMMEDAMVVYRLTRAPERRVFYIDVQQLPPYKAEAFIERMKDQFKKKKTTGRTGTPGASMVEERWHAPSADEDYWIPIRPNVNTRVETLPGAQNLGEIDDTLYFRNKLFVALNFPRSYYNNEDTQSTRITLSAQDVKFARLIERLQSYMQDAFWDICDRHLKLLGYPEETYEDLEVHMTPPSDWRELTRAEVVNNRMGIAGNLKGSQLMSDFDILTKILKYPDDEAKKMLSRLKIQKLEDLKMQIIAQNPTLLGIGLPGPDEKEIGTKPGGPNPMLGDEEQGQEGQPPEGQQPPPGGPPPDMGGGSPVPQGGPSMPGSGGAAANLPEPTEDDLRKYNLDVRDYGSEIDEEEPEGFE